jgi:hypothetical protein
MFTIGVAAINSDEEVSACDTFLAPSKLSGWGVFAARDFAANELVEIAPISIPLPNNEALIQTTVLLDYAYGGIVSFGNIMIYNHDDDPNVRIRSLEGAPPNGDTPGAISAVICYSMRQIKAGEELFSNYKNENGSGYNWFQQRGVEMKDVRKDSTRIASNELDRYKRMFCSKAISGMGLNSFVNDFHGDTLPLTFDTARLPSHRADWTIAKVFIKAEEQIETAPIIVLPLGLIGPLAPFCIQWQHLTERHQRSLQKLKETGKFRIVRRNRMMKDVIDDESLENTALLPIGGNVGLIQRVGSNDPNCHLEIISSGASDGNAGILFSIIAVRDIQVGETLRLNIHPSGTPHEKRELRRVLENRHHHIPRYLDEDVLYEDKFTECQR